MILTNVASLVDCWKRWHLSTLYDCYLSIYK